ncbi:MAG TPA: asparagine synthase (glutamine-hydrolyzing) [Candidatus Acidoferrales bacterium]|nr:asparagine synthase (glutamine-hydrolyzing) [Candidatus Acidoferrales bacterium]
MCGIAGILGSGPLTPPEKKTLARMARAMAHRGPDGEGFYFDGRLGLAHRRLSIIDLEGGKQPLGNEDGTIWVVFNGEIYNYLELRGPLVERGHRFATSSDTEVIVHLYEEKGEACFEELRGMFAIALWDAVRQRLVLARDRLGKKPLYYAALGERFLFASEIKALLEDPALSRDIDAEALSDYFSLLYIPAPKTVFRAARKVRPGHYLLVDEKGVRERQYWDLRFDADAARTEEQWCKDLLEAYFEAVRLRLRSDVPLGAFLSGGVDSSSVVALMRALGDGQVTTCSVGFAEREFDESAHAAAFAQMLRTEHHEERARADANDVIEKLAWFYDEPFADSSAVPTYYVSQAARRHVTVALSGDGGDENFAGYRRYYRDFLENRLRLFLPDRTRAAIFGWLSRWYPKMDWAPRVLRAQATFRALSHTPLEGYFYSVSGIKPHVKEAILNADFQSALHGYRPMDLFEDYYRRPQGADHLTRLQYLDIKTYLVDDILVKVDRASMANSLEVRCPLLDHKLMELAARIPSSLKLNNGEGKYIFKKALRPYVPETVLARRKQGFAVPLASWLRNELKDVAAGLILTPDPLGVLDRRGVSVLWQQHQSGRSDFGTELWTVLMFRLWEETHLKRRPRRAAFGSRGSSADGAFCPGTAD